MNVNLPATCPNGHTFPSGFVIGGGVRDVQITNNVVSCPVCGQFARVADAVVDSAGNLHFLRNTYRLLAASRVSKPELESLLAVLRNVDGGQLTTAEATTQIASIGPAFKKLIKPKDAATFWQMLGVILMLVLYLIDHWSERPRELNQTIINNITHQTTVQQSPVPPVSSKKKGKH